MIRSLSAHCCHWKLTTRTKKPAKQPEANLWHNKVHPQTQKLHVHQDLLTVLLLQLLPDVR